MSRDECAAAYAPGDRVRVYYMDGERVGRVEEVVEFSRNGHRLLRPYYRLQLPAGLGPPGLASYEEHEMEPA